VFERDVLAVSLLKNVIYRLFQNYVSAKNVNRSKIRSIFTKTRL
jgi:hypothetical protein